MSRFNYIHENPATSILQIDYSCYLIKSYTETQFKWSHLKKNKFYRINMDKTCPWPFSVKAFSVINVTTFAQLQSNIIWLTNFSNKRFINKFPMADITLLKCKKSLKMISFIFKKKRLILSRSVTLIMYLSCIVLEGCVM